MEANRGSKGQGGFTTIELIVVMVVIAILASLSIARSFSGKTFKLQAARDDVLNAIASAQQISMSRSGSTDRVEVVINSTSVDVTVNGSSINLAAIQFPVIMPSGVTLTVSPSGKLTFTSMGDTTAALITLQDSGGLATVTVASSGYAF